MLALPSSLNQLIAAGRWPRDNIEAERQNLKPLAPVERIQRLAPEEGSLYLYPPPFHTVAERAADNEYWLQPQCAPTEIEFALALDIGDFGLGSDAPILLDYRFDLSQPRVLRLRWTDHGDSNHWVEAAPNFDAFAHILGLLPIA